MSFRSVGIACMIAGAFAVTVPDLAFAQSSSRLIKRDDDGRGGNVDRNGGNDNAGRNGGESSRTVTGDSSRIVGDQVVRIYPESGEAGTKVSIRGRGFRPGNSVAVMVGRTPSSLGAVGSASADGDGRVRTDVRLPGWAQAGMEVYFGLRGSAGLVVGGPFYVLRQ